jgi:hypothetical protein
MPLHKTLPRDRQCDLPTTYGAILRCRFCEAALICGGITVTPARERVNEPQVYVKVHYHCAGSGAHVSHVSLVDMRGAGGDHHLTFCTEGVEE